MLVKPTARMSVWAAATSAVRTPSQYELEGQVNYDVFPDPFGRPAFIVLFANPDLKPERINTYELGYRWLATATTSLDIAAFHNDIRGLHASVTGQPYFDASGQMIVPITATDTTNAHSDGAELFVTHNVSKDWELTSGYSLFSAPRDPEPKHQLQVRSFVRLPRNFDFDSAVSFTDRIGGVSPLTSYTRVDAQLTWHATSKSSLSIAGQNLLDGSGEHVEFSGTTTLGALTPIRRTVYGKITWSF
jgi:outer membrane receptor protein involved in Fe transport